MKQLLKSFLGHFYCWIYGVKHRKNIYIGLGSKIVGGVNIILSDNVKIMPQAMIVSLSKGIIEIGESTEVSMYSRVASVGRVSIGRHVLMGPHVFIADYNHEYRDPTKPIMYQGNSFVSTKDGSPTLSIGDDSWIGTNVVIVGNVHIGKHCVIGANSVVTKDIPNYSVAAGIPARVVKRYDFEEKEWVRV